jgi:hypothetical protein
MFLNPIRFNVLVEAAASPGLSGAVTPISNRRDRPVEPHGAEP